jgi:formate hydrogenlyase subunit 3/multisubunit Na+/H+ antiporter MnhD subunit
VVGILLKCGMIPFHGWVPDSYMAAPPAVSVFFAGIVTKASGIYVIFRTVTSVLAGQLVLLKVILAVGLVSIVLGALGALAQKDLKRMLAYSSISQMGYMLIGVGSGSPLGMAGALFHFFNHAVFKASLFVNAAAIEQRTGTRDMEALRGLGNRMPITALTSVIASLSTAGIPPLSGFWSKVIILLAAWRAGYTAVAVVGALASLLTLAYMLGFQHRVFFRKEEDVWQQVTEADWELVAPALLLCVITVGMGLFFPYVVGSIFLPIASIL